MRVAVSRKPIKARPSRKLGQFHTIPELKRNNPQSLRKILYELTLRQFDRNLSRAASELKSALRTRRGRTLHSTLSGESLFNILSDRTHIKYYHLEAYARQLKIPVSLIVLYSRLTANQHDGTPHLNGAMLAAFSRIVQDASTMLTKRQGDPELFKIDDLLRWIELYVNEADRTENLSLFPSSEE